MDASGAYDSTLYDGYSEHQAPYGGAGGTADAGTEWHVSTEVLEAWRSDLATMGYATADLTLEQLYYLYMQQYAQDATVQEQYVAGYEDASGTYGCVSCHRELQDMFGRTTFFTLCLFFVSSLLRPPPSLAAHMYASHCLL